MHQQPPGFYQTGHLPRQQPTAGVSVPRPTDRATENRILILAIGLRLLAVGAMFAIQGEIYSLSRDTHDYHVKGERTAEEYRQGVFRWGLWIDEGWFRFIGWVFFLFGPQLMVVQLINVLLAAWAAVLCYRAAATVFDDEAVGRITGYLVACFPSIIYYTSLPLKEAASMFGFCAMLFGVATMIRTKSRKGLWWMLTGLAIMAALRLYMCIVCGACLIACLIPIRYARGILGLFQLGLVLLAMAAAGYVAVKVFEINTIDHETLRYFDLDYINNVRHDMSDGHSAMYDNKRDAMFGRDLLADVVKVGKGLLYFFFSINPADIGRARQLAAVPEMLFFIVFLPFLLVGIVAAWNRRGRIALPVIMIAMIVVLVYSSATTNGGAMFRWRVQVLPYLFMLIVYGSAVWRAGPLYGTIYQMQRERELRLRGVRRRV